MSRPRRRRGGPYRRRQREFSGDALRTVAFPLGGIGTGTVSLGGRGNLQDWEIFNRPGKGKSVPYTFFALWAKRDGEAPVTRVLERQRLPPYTSKNGFGILPVDTPGLPRLKECRFRGAYPFAGLTFDDPAVPLDVELEAFNPMVPLDDRVSGLPVAIFNWTLRNPGATPVEATVSFSLCNFVGYDGVTEFLVRPSGPLFGANVNHWIDDGLVRGLSMSRLPDAPAPEVHGGEPARAAPWIGDGSMAIATPWTATTFADHWERGSPGPGKESLGWFWETFSARGRLPSTCTGQPSAPRSTEMGTVGLIAAVPPGGEVTLPFVLAWHFPNLTNYWNQDSPVLGARLGNWYTTRHDNAWAVARETATRLGELYSRTREFHDALFGSTLPPVVLDAASSQVSTIRTATCLRTEDGTFHAFEGCADDRGCCPMDCTHVWNYEQALAHLYPALERTMRETDLRHNTRPTGRMSFRTLLPLASGQLIDDKPAADGQMGGVLKLYREWQLSGDTGWLRALWPQAKRALEWAWAPGSWDMDRDGVMEGEQHSTYDIEFFGPNTMMGTLYLGALKAAARMADALGDGDAAAYRALYEDGRRRLEAATWNGEYYQQRVVMPPPDAVAVLRVGPSGRRTLVPGEPQPRYQYGPGCLADQLLGQWFAEVVGLGDLLPQAQVRQALAALFRHNFRERLDEHVSAQRVYALNDDAGLVLCTWPRGGRPDYPFFYADEVWSGVEYQVAAHLMYEDMVDEGLRVVQAVRDRHDGARRNPWDEFECGHHYARAMSSWSLVLALSGYRYSAPERRIGFAPRVSFQDFRCFFSTGAAWGVYRQRVGPRRTWQRHTIEVREGTLEVKTLDLPLLPPATAGATPDLVTLRVAVVGGPRPEGRVTPGDAHAEVRLAAPVTLRAGQSLRLALSRES